jgi:hypothetical protein
MAWHGTAREGGGVPVGAAHMHAHVRRAADRPAGHPGGERTVRARAFSSGGNVRGRPLRVAGRRPVAIGVGEGGERRRGKRADADRAVRGTCGHVRGREAPPPRTPRGAAFLLRGPAVGSRPAGRRAGAQMPRPAGRAPPPRPGEPHELWRRPPPPAAAALSSGEWYVR